MSIDGHIIYSMSPSNGIFYMTDAKGIATIANTAKTTLFFIQT